MRSPRRSFLKTFGQAFKSTRRAVDRRLARNAPAPRRWRRFLDASCLRPARMCMRTRSGDDIHIGASAHRPATSDDCRAELESEHRARRLAVCCTSTTRSAISRGVLGSWPTAPSALPSGLEGRCSSNGCSLRRSGCAATPITELAARARGLWRSPLIRAELVELLDVLRDRVAARCRSPIDPYWHRADSQPCDLRPRRADRRVRLGE